MASKKTIGADTVDHLIKAMLVFSRSVDHILESRAVESAVNERLSASKVQVLRLLNKHAGQTSSQVARFLGVSKPEVSQIIDSLERRKLVLRKTGKRDRREANLQLTKEGKAWFRAVRSEQRHLLRGAIRESRDGRATRWITTIEEITRSLIKADRNFGDFCLQCDAHDDPSCVLEDGSEDCLYLRHRRGSGAQAAGRGKTPRARRRRKG